MKEDRKKIIEELRSLANTVLSLKTKTRQKRPIIIEFSGSPKAGKTSCISSLELFLRRNGFSVKIVQERASMCPVSDKQSPMFNMWTASTTLAEMIAVLNNVNAKVDILIFDRGIFDSLCWFQWLTNMNKMEEKQKIDTEKFLLMDEFIKKIDIVFAFKASPEESIKRENAHLLTDIEGTIMKKDILQEYIRAMESIIKEKKEYFHEIISIDTTDKNQNIVGKEVTKKTLEILKDALMERIGYIEASSIFMKDKNEGGVYQFEDNIEEPQIKFDLRDKVEENKDWIQTIPIALITNLENKKILIVKKRPEAISDDSPEKDKELPYVGGHSRAEDSTKKDNRFIDICRNTLKREIKEEIGISIALDNISPVFIYTPNNEKSRKHLAICFKVSIDENLTRLHIDQNELIQNKGKTSSGKFKSIDEVELDKLESWGRSIMKHYFKLEPEQISIDDKLYQ